METVFRTLNFFLKIFQSQVLLLNHTGWPLFRVRPYIYPTHGAHQWSHVITHGQGAGPVWEWTRKSFSKKFESLSPNASWNTVMISLLFLLRFWGWLARGGFFCSCFTHGYSIVGLDNRILTSPRSSVNEIYL